MKRLNLFSGMAFLLLLACAFNAAPAGAAVPTQIQHRGCPSGGGTSYTSYTCPLGEGTQSGNWLICVVQVGNTANTVSMTDENADTFTLDKKYTESSPINQDYLVFHAVPTAGSRIPVVNVSSTGAGFQQLSCGEYNNITALDLCSAGAQGSGTAVTAGSLTPTVTGDLIVQIAGNESGATPATWAHGSNSNITWNWQQNDRGYTDTNLVAQAAQWGVYNSTSAINGAITLGTSLAWGSVACAYKSGVAGTARPAGKFISALEHYNIANNASPATVNIPFDTANNLGVLGMINSTAGGTNPRISTISQSGTGSGNTWVKAGDSADAAGSGYMMFWYCPNCTFGDDSTLAITLIATNTFAEAELLVYGISGMASSPLDTSMTSSNGSCTTGYCTLTGTQGAGASPISTITVTPSAANGTIFGMMGVNSPQIRGINSPCTTDVAFSPQEAGINELDENNGRAHCHYSSASATTFSWTTSASALNGWQAVASNFLAAAAAGGTHQLLLLGVGGQ